MTHTPNFPITQLAVELTAEECWLVFSRYRPPILWGMRRPYMGKTPDEIEAANQKALQRLQERQLVACKDAKTLQMDAWLDEIARVCSQPEFTLLVQVWQQGQRAARQHYFHFQGERAVEQTEIGRGNYRFMALRDGDTVQDHLKQVLDLPFAKGDNPIETALPENVFLSVAELCAHGETASATQQLNASQPGNEASDQIVAALSAGAFKASLALICTRDSARPWQVRGLSIVAGAGAEGLWLFRTGGNAEVTCSLKSSQDALQAALGMLP